MMNNRIIHLLENDSKISFSDKKIIEEELSNYPYVPSFKMLYLKWSLLFDKENADKSVQEVASMVSYRELIKQLVDKATVENKIMMSQGKGEKEEVLVAEKEEQDNEKSQKSEITIEEPVNSDILEENQKTFQESQEMQTPNQKNQTQEVKEIEQESTEYSYLDKLGLSHLFNTPNKQTEDKEQNFTQSQLSEEKFPIDKKEEAEAILQKEEDLSQETGKVINLKKEEAGKFTFNQWLALSKEKQENPLKSQEKQEQKQQEEVINKFIENNPKITPPKKIERTNKNIEFKNEEIQDIANLMTITLAQLYVEQGKYDTAITAFKILSLKYPEKSSYFVSEIKKIKKIKKLKNIK